MKKFKFGPLSIDAAEYASHGNGILGIRGSGKTYTATGLAEHLFDAGIPFFAFDPIGVWRWLRVPGKGKGYPVVVAGGQAGDLPLTVEATPDLVRAAMQGGVSLVFDLFDMSLSKGGWRKIVTAAVRTMLHENHAHGLRHVFIEEAAEFIPQKPIDWIVYAEIEKLARMGGNVRLGYTLINQRSQEVSKAILELCENVFLHRQRGKNALENMDKWLQVAGASEQKKIIASLPELPQGQCWAWLGGDEPQPPTLVKVPAKNGLHPDRRVMRADASVVAVEPVDVAEFVARMRGQIEAKATPVIAHNPKPISKTKEAEVTKDEAEALRAENDQLQREVDQLRGNLARAVERTGTVTAAATPPVSLDQTMDNEALYQAIKARLAKEAPQLIRLLVERPAIEVKIERKTLTLDTSSLKGRVAHLLANGFFDDGRKQTAVRNELKRTGPDVNDGNLYQRLKELQADGFLTVEGDKTYRAVQGMKVNIV